MESKDNLATVRLRLPYDDESSFVSGYASLCRRGTLFLPTRKLWEVGTQVRFELLTREGGRLMLGEGRVVEGRAPASRSGVFLRVVRLDSASKRLYLRLKEAADPKEAGPPDLSAESPSTIGIDLGTSRCRAATVVDGEPRLIELAEAEPSILSGVASGPGESLLVGEEARARRAEQPDQAVFAGKRLLGRGPHSPWVRAHRQDLPFTLVEGSGGVLAALLARLSPTFTEITGRILEEVRAGAERKLNAPCRRAVVAVPAGFSHSQREALKEAARRAGMEMVRLVGEPLAAAMTYGAGKGLAAKRLVVIDLGAGFLDVAVLTVSGDSFEVVGSGGEMLIGGLEFDEGIASHLIASLAAARGPESPGWGARERLSMAAEEAKIALSEAESHVVRLAALWRDEMTGEPRNLEVEISREDLEGRCREIVERVLEHIREVLGEQGLDPGQIDEVILAGGQSRMPLLRRAVEATFGRPPCEDVEPEGAVALGCAVLAASLDSKEDPSAAQLVLRDVLASPVSVGLRGGGLMPVVERGTSIPCERTIYVETLRDNQDAVHLLLFRGGGDRAEYAEYLHTLTFSELPERPAGEMVLRIRLAIDEEGFILVQATDDDTDEPRSHSVSVERSGDGLDEALESLDTVIRDLAGPGKGLPPDAGEKAPERRGLFGGLRRKLFGRRR